MKIKKINWLAEFHYVVASGSPVKVKKTLERKPADVSIDQRSASSLQGMSALEYSVYKSVNPSDKRKEVIKVLLRSGANPFQFGKKGIVGYQAISILGPEAVVEFLEHFQAPIHSGANTTALYLSVIGGNASVMQLCLENGADPDTLYADGLTPIHWAMKSRNATELVKKILDNGGDINIRTIKGHTPLHTAMSLKLKDCVEMVNLLLKYNPDLTYRCAHGLTPLYLAIHYEHFDVNLVKGLLARGSDPNYQNHLGGNSLHLITTSSAAHWKIPDVCEVLIKYGASVNLQDYAGNTPMHYAVFNNAVIIAECLLKNGADLTLKNFQHRTPLEFLHTCPEHNDMARVLVKHIMLQSYTSGAQVSEEFSNVMASSRGLRQIKRECRKELKHMKRRLIKGTQLNFLKVYSAKFEELLVYLKNEKTLSALDKNRAKDYLNYGEPLRKKVRAGIRRKKLQDTFLDVASTNIKSLPLSCLQNVSDFMSNKELEEYITTHSNRKVRR